MSNFVISYTFFLQLAVILATCRGGDARQAARTASSGRGDDRRSSARTVALWLVLPRSVGMAVSESHHARHLHGCSVLARALHVHRGPRVPTRTRQGSSKVSDFDLTRRHDRAIRARCQPSRVAPRAWRSLCSKRVGFSSGALSRRRHVHHGVPHARSHHPGRGVVRNIHGSTRTRSWFHR